MSAAFEVRGLRWKLGEQFTLRIPELALPAGKTTALLGRSASGKSTLLKLLGRVEGSYFAQAEDIEGEVWFAGDGEPVELTGLSERDLMRRGLRGPRIGFVFQREGLFPGLDVVANVAWPLVTSGVASKAEADARARAMLTRVNLGPDRNVATLSGGERKRLALARALAFDPAVLLLDEPLTGLDPEALGGLLELLAEMAAHPERTIVMVTHQRSDVERLAEHLVFMDGGSVAAAGPRDALTDTLGAFFEGAAVSAPATEPNDEETAT